MKILSIAVPCYNSQEYMRKCIDSLLVGGDEVEIISPNRETFSFVVPEIYDNELNILECARHPEEIIKFKLNREVSKYDMMRIKIK